MMQDSFMFKNRFNPGIGGYQVPGRFGQNAYDMPSSAQYRQFHQMKAQMPSDVLQLFKANQVGFIKAPVKPKCRLIDPITNMKINLVEMFQIPNLELMEAQKPQTRDQRLLRIAKQKKELNENRIRVEIEQWNPFEDEKALDSDPERTLLVARLNYETTEKTLKFEFEKYGIIKKVRIIKDSTGKSRGYGFVEFDNKEDFINAFKQANHRKIDGKRILVDYEKGRTLLKWRPRRFGVGAGESRLTKEQLQIKQKEERQKKLEDRKEKKKSPGRHSRSRSPRRQKRRDENNDERDRKRRPSKDRRDKRDARDGRDGRDGRRQNTRRDR